MAAELQAKNPENHIETRVIPFHEVPAKVLGLSDVEIQLEERGHRVFFAQMVKQLKGL